MKLHLSQSVQNHLIKSCVKSDNGFKIQIDDTVYTKSLILTSEKLEMWPVNRVSDLSADHFSRLGEYHCEVIILGTKFEIAFPDAGLILPLINSGIGLEVMDTPAACRTYNILSSDGRNALCALIL